MKRIHQLSKTLQALIAWDAFKLRLFFEGILVGFVVGLIIGSFVWVLHQASVIRQFIYQSYITPALFAGNWLPFIGWIVFSLLLSLIIYRLCIYETMAMGGGIPQVKGELLGIFHMKWLSVLYVKFIGVVLGILGGLSIGREAPSVQIGAAAAKGISRLFGRFPLEEKYLITSGSSAGLAAAFNAPVAGILFAVEEVHRHISKKLLVVCMAATITADLVSKILYGTETVFNFSMAEKLPLVNYWTLILFAVVLSILGVLYIFLMEFFMKIQDGLKLKKEFKLIPYFLLPIVILIFTPNLLGGGGFLMKELQTVDFPIYMLILLFIVKLLFSIICFSSGVPGGIFFPILVLGATVGTIFGKIIDPIYINSFIILGMAGYLTAIVRAPLTSIVLIFEMTGNLSYLLPLSIVCLITYSIPNYLKSLPIYEYLLERLMEREHIATSKDGEKMTMSIVVEIGSEIENKKIKEVEFPKGMLIINKLFDTFNALQKICQNN